MCSEDRQPLFVGMVDMKTHTQADPFCPPGHRFVVQFIDEPTRETALARFIRMVGEERAKGAVVVPGSRVLSPSHGEYGRVGEYRTGWRVYLKESR